MQKVNRVRKIYSSGLIFRTFTVDSETQNLLQKETEHWHNVIERIMYAIQFLLEQNLAFS